MAKATVRGFAAGFNSAATANIVVAAPADSQTGDWMVVEFVTAGATTTIATPSGWTLLASTISTGSRGFYSFGKRKVANEPDATFVQSGTPGATWSMLYGPGGETDFSKWGKTRYPNDVGTLFDYDKRYTQYLASGSTDSTTTRVRGMAVPANSLVLTFMGEATSASETESQISLEGATKAYWFGGGASPHIGTHLWGVDTVTTAKTTADAYGRYPNTQNSNGAGHQLAIPELVDVVVTPGVTAFPVTMEAVNPFTVGQNPGGFTLAAAAAKNGSQGLQRTSNSSHAQALLPDDFRGGPGVRVSAWVRLDNPAGGTPNLAGIVVAGSTDSAELANGWQAVIDTRNATNGSTSFDNQRGFHLRNSQGAAAASAIPALPIVGSAWYFIEMDWRYKVPLIVARLWREIDGELKLQATISAPTSFLSPDKPQKIGVYSYGAASWDDFNYQVVPSAKIKYVDTDGKTLVDGVLKMPEADSSNPLVPVERFWQVQRGRPISRWFEDGHVACMAHRGGSYNFAEHSARAYTECAILGVDIMEFSVGFTSDNKMFGLHDDTGNRTTPELPANTKPGDLTLDQWLALTAIRPATGDKRFGRQPYIELKTALDAYLGWFSFMIDCKYGGIAGLKLILDLCDTYPNARDWVCIKYFHTAVELARYAKSRGYKSWGYGYFTDVDGTNATQMSATQMEWDFLGMEYGGVAADGVSPSDAAVAAWATVTSYGKPVFAHIVPSVAAANRGLRLGAKALQISNVIDVMASRP
jgi:hypothetical protein